MVVRNTNNCHPEADVAMRNKRCSFAYCSGSRVFWTKTRQIWRFQQTDERNPRLQLQNFLWFCFPQAAHCCLLHSQKLK